MPIVLKSVSLNVLESSGPAQVSNGIALPLPLPFYFFFDITQGELKSGVTAIELSVKPITFLKWVITLVYTTLGLFVNSNKFELPSTFYIVVPNTFTIYVFT